MSDASDLHNALDGLLQQYLELLNAYTTLRRQLNEAQADVSTSSISTIPTSHVSTY
jgi:hypothetical protein